ncbi:MAG: hypothetical protein GVY10_01245 [Verrucomicrobia bacterium]|jgi:chromosome segregation ATPase|nr:hypothetical protein [Verrucomicrobiota bacterium]
MSLALKISSPSSGLSIDAILQRTRPAERLSNNLIPFRNPNPDASEKEETSHDLLEREKHLFQTRAELNERERLVNESELLLSARERLLDNREQLLSKRMSAFARRHGNNEWLQKALSETKAALAMANEAFAEKEELVERLQREVEELKQARAQVPANPTEESGNDDPYAKVSAPSLAEQVALLKEREAFIEESENTLFNKAQELQERETRLQHAEETA